jgi:ribose transport system permease protein
LAKLYSQMQKLGVMLGRQGAGLVLVILFLGIVMSSLAGSHVDRLSGQSVNNFLNPSTLLQVATDTSFFAIMAVGMTVVIISGGIDLSVGSIYALSGVASALALKSMGSTSPLLAACICIGTGALAGLLNGTLIAQLGVHPFIITLGTMWVYRGFAFVTTKAQSVLVPDPLTEFIKSTLGLRKDLYPIPMIVMLLMTITGILLLTRTVWGRRVFAIGGNVEASRYAGVPIGRVVMGVYLFSGLTAGVAAFLGSSFYGSASSGDAQGYELFVIASAVVGGASLSGGKGAALGALLGALLIVMIRQSIRTLRLDQNYEWIIIGVAIILAVVIDRLNALMSDGRMRRTQ